MGKLKAELEETLKVTSSFQPDVVVCSSVQVVGQPHLQRPEVGRQLQGQHVPCRVTLGESTS